jgi:transcriptional regulator with XRE-family HTH domain
MADAANARKLSQKEVADAAGVKQSSISRWLAYKIDSLQVRHVMALEERMGLPHGALTSPPAAFAAHRRAAP